MRRMAKRKILTSIGNQPKQLMFKTKQSRLFLSPSESVHGTGGFVSCIADKPLILCCLIVIYVFPSELPGQTHPNCYSVFCGIARYCADSFCRSSSPAVTASSTDR